MAQQSNLAQRFAIDEDNLSLRREFARLGEEDRQLLEELIPWAEDAAPKLAKEFYDWQFSFEPTKRFFEGFSRQHNMPLKKLRDHLENAQTGYLREIFTGAKDNWGVSYFESRLHIGAVHDRINLPLKWFIGAYNEYDALIHKHLSKHWKDPEKVYKAEAAIRRVMNVDIQAIADSFLMSTLDSIGLSVEGIEAEPGQDRTEALVRVKEMVGTLRGQADAIADGRFDDESLAVAVPGALGETFSRAVDSLQKLLGQARVIAEGQLDAAELDEHVEGQLGEAFAHMKENLTNVIVRIQANGEALARTADQMKAVSETMTTSAEATSGQANSASAASEQISKSIQTVATAAEEMNSTIKEISRNVSESSKIAVSASDMAASTNALVGKLSESSEQINNVVKVITDIAEQTNLLALNATIEAARAGDAGKGFAVVANEVKELAKETTRSTGEIRSQVKRIQDDTAAAVDAIQKIGEIIKKINDTQAVIASAVEEQTATTSDIARTIGEAAKGSEDISHNIAEVAKAAKSTEGSAAETTTAAGELTRMTDDLKDSISIFRVKSVNILPTSAAPTPPRTGSVPKATHR